MTVTTNQSIGSEVQLASTRLLAQATFLRMKLVIASL